MNTAQTPEAIPQLFVENWNKRRPQEMLAAFEEDADFINVVGLWWQNKAAILKAHDYGLRTIFQHSTLEIIKQKTKLLSNDIAVLHVKLKLTGQTALEGQVASTRKALLTFFVRKKEDNYWWVVSAQNTDIVPGAETYINTGTAGLQAANYSKL